MQNQSFKDRYQARRKRALDKPVYKNMVLLLLPALLIAVLLMASLYTYGVSLLLTYFILPMFYTVDKRLRHNLTGIGKREFNYGDGYKAIFQSNKGGIFGVAISLVFALTSLLLLSGSVGMVIPHIVNNFLEAKPVFDRLLELYTDVNVNPVDLNTYILQNGYHLTRPLTIYVGLIAFIPIFITIFIFITNNLSNHYLCSIVLPDIDLNISAAQARSVARGSFGRGAYTFRLKEQFRLNWPLYVLFAMIYGMGLYGASFITTGSTYFMPLIMMIVPCSALIVAVYINYFCLMNNYVVIEENQEMILASIPAPMRTSIYQTYNSKEYIHGEESLARGGFVPAPTYFQERQTDYQAYQTSQTRAQQTSTSVPSKPSDTASAPEGVVIDLSQDAEKKGDGE